MTTADSIIRAAPKYLGTPYSTLDCQAFVERCLSDAGLKKNLAGSNAWYRFLMQEGWVGTPEECKAKFGMIPPGAFLLILSNNGAEPSKYHGDGIGNASHIGLYTNLSGAEMASMALKDGVAKARQYDFGNGAIHSSSSRGEVCTSNFSGKAINGGWNRIGLWRKISYGEKVDRILSGGEEIKVEYQAKVVGGNLNMREQPSKSAERLCQIPDGSIVTVTDEAVEWAKTSYNGQVGWVMKQFLEPVGDDKDTVTVNRKELERIYDQIGDWLGLRG